MFHVSILDSLSLFGVTPLLSLTVLQSAANALMTSLPRALRGWVLQCGYVFNLAHKHTPFSWKL